MASWPGLVRSLMGFSTKPRLKTPELADYFRGKLDLAVSLACHGEQERRSGHRASAEEYQRQDGKIIRTSTSTMC